MSEKLTKNDLGQWSIEKADVELRDKTPYHPSDGPRYHIHVDGERTTQDPLSLKQINNLHGGVKRLESSGARLIPYEEPTSKEELDKSNYGPKEMKLYNPTDNIERKANRTGEELENVGQNKAVHQYTSATMGTAKQQAVAEGKKTKALSGPVKSFKDMTPEEQAKLKAQYEVKKGEDMEKSINEEVEKMEPLSKPPVSQAQRAAMHAAAQGKSTLGIPKEVGKEFAAADEGGKLPEKIEKEETCKFSENGQWSLDKVEDVGRGGKPKDISMFSGDHMNHVITLPHSEAKKYAHETVDASTAKPENKAKAKAMIDKSKNSKHIAMGMANFALSSEGLGAKLKD